ncbi:MAG: ABC transporter permease [Bacteroidota bacterium]
MILKTAWRNIWRHRMRSLAIAGAVAIGIWSGTSLMAFYFGMGEQRIQSGIEKEISHIQIHDIGFRNDFGMGRPIKEAERIENRIAKNDSVYSYAFRTVAQAMASSPSGSSGIQLTGIDPDPETRTTKLSEKLIKGAYLGDSIKNKVLVGEKLFKKLKLEIGRKLIITFNDTSGELIAAAFKVTGVFKTASEPYDERTVFVDRTILNRISGIQGAANEIAILLKSNSMLDGFKQSLKSDFPYHRIEDWREIAPELEFITVAIDRMLYVFMGIILLAIAFGIVNTMMMSILERTRELGMLMALGMSKGRIFSMIVSETLFLSLAGCPAGLIASFVTIGYFHTNGLHLPQFEATFRSFGYDPVVYPFLETSHYIRVLVMVLVTALLSSLLPSRHALRIDPGVAIRK